ncbi:hypothetical protein G7Z17_g9917 [Cylindrodendrum hubeiense]|uniref:Peptidase A1 domain-containing protein n=1 Tax=Cylindrodendrum hubeiense TaxID=595255 RepID=A0A9P5LCU9_9HYPO|nr:hypothetical protein G7Z17_g9917 [Cylindrodendrum hubeiense]
MNGVTFQRAKAISDPTPDRVSLRSSRLENLKGKAKFHGHPGISALERAGLVSPRKSQNVSTVGDFSTQYALQCEWDGEEISGPMGRSDISCGGLFVPEQQVGLANKTYWHGNNVTVGILGLAYPSITSAYYGQVGEEEPWLTISYTPFLTRAISQGTIDPVFSVAIMRNSSSGILTWGGLPPMLWNPESKAVTDLIIANLIDQEETAWEYSFYTIIPDGLVWGLTRDTTQYPYIVDTGTTMMHLPPPLAEAIARAFKPRATYIYQWGAYFVPCDAIAPRFAVIISGVEFWINRADLIYQDLIDPLTGLCACGISTGGPGPYILGDVFLQNVLAVFDIGAAEMRFYSRD